MSFGAAETLVCDAWSTVASHLVGSAQPVRLPGFASLGHRPRTLPEQGLVPSRPTTARSRFCGGRLDGVRLRRDHFPAEIRACATLIQVGILAHGGHCHRWSTWPVLLIAAE